MLLKHPRNINQSACFLLKDRSFCSVKHCLKKQLSSKLTKQACFLQFTLEHISTLFFKCCRSPFIFIFFLGGRTFQKSCCKKMSTEKNASKRNHLGSDASSKTFFHSAFLFEATFYHLQCVPVELIFLYYSATDVCGTIFSDNSALVFCQD